MPQQNSLQDAKDILLGWIQDRVRPYGQHPENFSSSLDDGAVISALVASVSPTFSHYENMEIVGEERFDRAFEEAERAFGVPQLVTGADLVGCVDEKSAITYLSLFYRIWSEHQEKEKEAGEHFSVKGGGEGWEGAKVDEKATFSLDFGSREGGEKVDLSEVKCTLVSPTGKRIPVQNNGKPQGGKANGGEEGKSGRDGGESGEGKGTFEYTPTEEGTHSLEVEYKGKKVLAKSLPVKPRNKFQFQFSDDSDKKTPLGCPSNFTLRAVGADGKDAADGVDLGDLEIEMVGTDGERVPVEVSKKDGALICDYVPTAVGKAKVVMKYRGEECGEGEIEVENAQLRGGDTIFSIEGEGAGWEGARVDKETAFSLNFGKGKNGEEVDLDEVKCALVSPSGKKVPIDAFGNGDQEKGKEDGTRGSFRYTPSEEGMHSLEVEYKGKPAFKKPIPVKPRNKFEFQFCDDTDWKKTSQGHPSNFTMQAVGPDGKKVAEGVNLGELEIEILGADGKRIPVDVSEQDGVVVCNYTPPVAGKAKVVVKYEGEGCGEGEIEVEAAKLGIEAEGNGLKGGLVGEEAEFTVAGTEGFPPVPFDLSLLECEIIGPNKEEIPVKKGILGDGGGEEEGEEGKKTQKKASFNYTPTKKGLHTISLTYKGEEIFRRPIIVKPPPLHLNVFGPGLHELQAQVPTEFTIAVLAGEKGKTLVCDLNDFFGEVISPSGDPLPDIFKRENDDHSVTFSFTPLVEGKHVVHTEYEGVTVLDHPLVASPPPTSKDRHFTLTGGGLQKGTVGVKGTFEVTMFDQPGGKQMSPDGKLSVVVVGKGAGEGEGEVIPAYVEEQGEKEVSKVSYTPIQPGEHKVTVIYNDKYTIIDQTVMVAPRPTQLHFDVKGAGLHGAMVGEEGKFTVGVIDKGSGEGVSSLESLGVSLVKEGGEGEKEEVTMTEDAGVTTVKYVVKSEGKYTLTVLFDGNQLLKKVIPVKKSSGSALQFSIKGAGLKEGVVGVKGTFMVKSIQRGSSRVVAMGDKLSCSIVGPGEKRVEAHQEDGEGGGKEVWWVPEVEGVHSILLKYGEKKLVDTKVVVKAGEEKGEKKEGEEGGNEEGEGKEKKERRKRSKTGGSDKKSGGSKKKEEGEGGKKRKEKGKNEK